jgi:3',5'-nucleoside bisphosphate phosphatase
MAEFDPGLRADLHVHTWFSDGRCSPAEVVARAKAAGIGLIAITDHDTVAGIAQARESGREAGIEVVAGIEFAARFKAVEVHLTGLWIDPAAPGLAPLLAALQAEREERATLMLARLQSLGIRIGIEDVRAEAGLGGISRPHLAQALVKRGAVADFHEAFSRYLGQGRPAYVPRHQLRVATAVAAIHDAGGAAVLAHGLIGGPQREHARELVRLDLDALEVVHPKLGPEQSAWLRELARAEGLAISGGSDWHGEGWSEGRIGEYNVDGEAVNELFRRASKHRTEDRG